MTKMRGVTLDAEWARLAAVLKSRPQPRYGAADTVVGMSDDMKRELRRVDVQIDEPRNNDAIPKIADRQPPIRLRHRRKNTLRHPVHADKIPAHHRLERRRGFAVADVSVQNEIFVRHKKIAPLEWPLAGAIRRYKKAAVVARSSRSMRDNL